MLDGRHVMHADAVAERLATHVAGLLERGLAASRDILLERAGVLLGEVSELGIHTAPRYRTTRTSASSACVPHRASTWSASACGS